MNLFQILFPSVNQEIFTMPLSPKFKFMEELLSLYLLSLLYNYGDFSIHSSQACQITLLFQIKEQRSKYEGKSSQKMEFFEGNNSTVLNTS